MNTCKCGCGAKVNSGRIYVSGHNLKDLPRTDAHRKAIGDGQRNAWQTKRQRMPIGKTYIDFGGYVRVKITEGKGRWKLQHVIVMEEMLGRLLNSGEIVHHINGDRKDNRPENLFLCQSPKHHNAVHRTQDDAFRRCLELGVVVFKEGRYELA